MGKKLAALLGAASGVSFIVAGIEAANGMHEQSVYNSEYDKLLVAWNSGNPLIYKLFRTKEGITTWLNAHGGAALLQNATRDYEIAAAAAVVGVICLAGAIKTYRSGKKEKESMNSDSSIQDNNQQTSGGS